MPNCAKVQLLCVEWEVLVALLKSLNDGRHQNWLVELSSRLVEIIEAKLADHYKANPE